MRGVSNIGVQKLGAPTHSETPAHKRLGVGYDARIVFTPNRHIPTFVAMLLIVVGLSACGSNSSAKNATRPSTVAQPTVTAQAPRIENAADRIGVVHVGGKSITKAALDHWIAVRKPKIAVYEPQSRAACSSVRAGAEVSLPKLAKGHRRPTGAQIKRLCEQQHEQLLRNQVLYSLIASEWVIQEAAEEGTGVSDSEAERQLKEGERKQFSSEAEFQQYLKSSGMTVADLLLGVKVELAGEKIRQMIKNRVGNITQARIADYYNAHRQLYSEPERRDIEAIRTWTKPGIEKAEKEVRSGVSFADVAKRVSIDRPSNEHGGVTLGVVPGQEEPGYDEAIFAAKPHVLTGPLHLRQRYYIFEVNRITPGRQKSFAEIEASIAKQLPTELQQQALASFIKAWRKKWTAKTDCRPGYVVLKCRQYKVSSSTPPEDPYTLN